LLLFLQLGLPPQLLADLLQPDPIAKIACGVSHGLSLLKDPAADYVVIGLAQYTILGEETVLGTRRQNRFDTVNGRFAAANDKSIYTHGKPGSPAPSDTTVVRKTAAPKRVLLIEDHIDAVRSLAFLLEDMGHDVDYAINGYAGIEKALQFRPDFILLDLGLPGIDGFEVCKRLKKEPALQRTRIIAVTAWSQDEHRVRSKAAGCELHLVKPVPVRLLEDLLG
jgi:CheY-like chemotaxis protein